MEQRCQAPSVEVVQVLVGRDERPVPSLHACPPAAEIRGRDGQPSAGGQGLAHPAKRRQRVHEVLEDVEAGDDVAWTGEGRDVESDRMVPFEAGVHRPVLDLEIQIGVEIEVEERLSGGKPVLLDQDVQWGLRHDPAGDGGIVAQDDFPGCAAPEIDLNTVAQFSCRLDTEQRVVRMDGRIASMTEDFHHGLQKKINNFIAVTPNPL